MKRISSRIISTEIAEAFNFFPEPLQHLLKFDVFNGDPIFAGIALYGDETSYGRSYHDTAHVGYPWHMIDKQVTVVLPKPIGVAYTVHELAHVLDYALDFSIDVQPVTKYAHTNRAEAFAEFVTAAFVPGYLDHDHVSLQQEPLAKLRAV